MPMELAGIIILAMIVGVFIWMFSTSRKKKWYKVYLTNNDVLLLSRDLRDRWWRTSDKYTRFNKEDGTEITFPSSAHWILMWEEIPTESVPIVRDEIRRMKEAQAKAEA